MAKFQSTPANFTAGDASLTRLRPEWIRFNPRPPISQRATSVSSSTAPSLSLFQSTPANFTAGDTARGERSSRLSGFQSTPANFTAGDLGVIRLQRLQVVSIHARQFHSGRRPLRGSSRQWNVFQSTPANFTAGDLTWRPPSIHSPPVSIHARQFHSGRRAALAISSAMRLFQSTPANFTAGDVLPGGASRVIRSFNPRPPISQRATCTSTQRSQAPRPFQSTPANFTAGDAYLPYNHLDEQGFQSTPANFTAGDAAAGVVERGHGQFQSTPANFTAGDPITRSSSSPLREFQSTPANFTAGDSATAHRSEDREMVSIHARQFHSGRRRRRCGADRRDPRFNPRPPISQRATASSIRPRPAWTRFNPRPPISQRATAPRPNMTRSRRVSIHARQFHSGRPSAPTMVLGMGAFQSTPANFTAGDASCRRDAPLGKSFNPRPPISQRATRADQRGGGGGKVSIHARQFHSGRPAWPSAASGCARGFNPRPPISQRATACCTRTRAAPRRRFNPRPPISQRATG